MGMIARWMEPNIQGNLRRNPALVGKRVARVLPELHWSGSKPKIVKINDS